MNVKRPLHALKRLLSVFNRPARDGGDDYTPERRRVFAKIQEIMDYEFNDLSLLSLALVHRSHVHLTGATRLDSNERLEFLGDAVLGLVANAYLYRVFPDCQEGDLTKMKSKLVCGDSLAIVAEDLQLGRFIQMSKGEAATGGRQRSSILADVVEALFGAVYLDGGFASAERLVSRWILTDAGEMLSEDALGNFKSRLQELVQARYKAPPRYTVVSQQGPDHDKHFVVQVRFGNRVMGEGRGQSKKTAEQLAARAALARIDDGESDTP